MPVEVLDAKPSLLARVPVRPGRRPLDPAPSGPFHVDPRQPPVYQRDIDLGQGIYWINTSRPLANKLLDQHAAASHARWREYLFQRYIDIILKQSVYELAKREAVLTDYRIDQLIDDVTSKVHDAAAAELEQFLFEDKLTGSAPSAAPTEMASDPSAESDDNEGGVPSSGVAGA